MRKIKKKKKLYARNSRLEFRYSRVHRTSPSRRPCLYILLLINTFWWDHWPSGFSLFLSPSNLIFPMLHPSVPVFLRSCNRGTTCQNSCSCSSPNPNPSHPLRERYDLVDPSIPVKTSEGGHHVFKREEYGHQWRDLHDARRFSYTPHSERRREM